MPSSGPRLKFRMLQDMHPLRIEATGGTSRTLVVSMTSVGTERHEWPPKEFVKIASCDGQNHVLCVTDISRSWMNGAGLVNRVADAISDYVLAHGIIKIVGIGTSMGASNLLVQGRKTPFTRIVAISPQYSVHPDIVPEEKRWRFFRKQITKWRYRDFSKLPDCDIVMLHGDTPDEQMHWRKFAASPNLQHYILPGNDHNFPRRLNDAGDLEWILRPAIRGRYARMEGVLETLGALRRDAYEARFDT